MTNKNISISNEPPSNTGALHRSESRHVISKSVGNYQNLKLLTASLATVLSSCGGGVNNFNNQTTTEKVSPANNAEAARFLQQAQFSSTLEDINALRSTNYVDWLKLNFEKPQGQTGWSWLRDRPRFDYGELNHVNDYANHQYYGDYMIWNQLLSGEDPFRRRMALALSEFFVVSLSGIVMAWRGLAIAAWWDLLVNHAFGNFRDLLEEVTLNPAMGVYLNTRGNQKADSKGRVPDENYAREIMQLFTIGLYQLNQDGTYKLNQEKQPLDAYTQEDVSQLAKVFTGYDFNVNGKPPVNFLGGVNTPPEFTRTRMLVVSNRHSEDEVQFLGTKIEANTAADIKLSRALDTLFQHPNVGPFFGRQMIQRLVTSNPSPAYVARVAAAFNDNGAGVRGDLKAVWSAILLDPEARDSKGLINPLHGKIREPMLRFIQWARSFKVNSIAGSWKIRDLSSPSKDLGQVPLRSPSVFNFFRPGYVAPSTGLAELGGVAPELQILTEVSIPGFFNFMQEAIRKGLQCPDPTNPGFQSNGNSPFDVVPNYADEIMMAESPIALVSHLNLILCAERIPDTQIKIIVATLDDMIKEQGANAATEQNKLNRVAAAIFMTMASSAYLVQK